MKTTNNNSTPPNIPRMPNDNRNTIGAIIIITGLALLLKNLNIGDLFPDWLFSWPMILVVVGLIIGVNSKFERKASIILLIIGGLFLFREITDLSFGRVILPLGIIILGYYLISKKNTNYIPPVPPVPPGQDDFDWDKRVVNSSEETAADGSSENKAENTDPNFQSSYQSTGKSSYDRFNPQSEDILNVNSAFSSLKKLVLSKKFLGGRVSNLFGSVQINLLQADLQQPVAIEVFQLFGSTQIILPSHWQASSNISSLLGDVDDRRFPSGIGLDPNKKIYITGSTIFGGITLKNA